MQTSGDPEPSATEPDAYKRQVQAQIDQYAASSAEMHDLPAVAGYMHETFHLPRIKEVFGATSVVEVFSRHFEESLRRTDNQQLISLGSGDCALELDVAQSLLERGAPPFLLTCYELSPVLAERGRAAAADRGLDHVLCVVEQDLNAPMRLEGPVAAFMAHHSLHHIVQLEALFDTVRDHLHEKGSFVIADMIGRNGHARWPEVLTLIREIWATLPKNLKFDHMFEREDRWFENRDCSIEGFEGIRAQDISGLLLARFHYQKILAWGGIIDVFTDRSFGPNYHIQDAKDLAFLGSLQAAEDELIRTRRTTPTIMIAVLTLPGHGHETRCWEGIGTSQIVRQADHAYKPIRLCGSGISIPYRNVTPPSIERLPNDGYIGFGAEGNCENFLRWGWADAEPHFRWAMGESSAIEFACPHGASVSIQMEISAYVPSFSAEQRVDVRANGLSADTFIFPVGQQTFETKVIELASSATNRGRVILEFFPSSTRRADIEGGVDKRPLTFTLRQMEVKSVRKRSLIEKLAGLWATVFKQMTVD